MQVRGLKWVISCAALALLACDDGTGGVTQEGDDGGGAGGAGGSPALDGGIEPARDARAPTPDSAELAPDAADEADAAEIDPDAAAEDPDATVLDPDAGGDDPDQGPPAMGQVHGGKINTLAIAGDPAAAGCRDLTGDGVPDNSLSLAAGLANEALQMAVTDGSLNMLPTAIGLDAPGMNGQFDLALLTGDAVDGGFQVSDAALEEDGSPRVIFGGTRIAGGLLEAGPGDFPVAIPVGGMDLDLLITDTTINGVAGIDANGFFINSGVISGIIPHDALVAALESTDFAFAAAFVPADINGTGNSICLTFVSEGATLIGFPVE